MRLSEIISSIPGAALSGHADIEISRLSIDSRSCGPGDLFVALRGGEEQDRHAFIPGALARGVSAVMLEDDIATGDTPRVRVADIKRAFALVADHFYAHPWRDLLCVGITGTSGKTTVSFLVRSILEAAGMRTGRIGTHHNVVGGALEPSHNTTPFAHDVFRILRDMVDKGDSAVVMEATSHALALDRVYGIGFRLGLFTNLRRDHLNFHGTIEAYAAAKAILFERLDTAHGAKAVINADDVMAGRLREITPVPVITYGVGGQADVRPRSCVSNWQGTSLVAVTPAGPVTVRSHLRGPFNVSNLLGAIAAGVALDISPEAISKGIEPVQVPGRFESVDAGQPFAIIVDFAHKPDALENVLDAARGLTDGRVICVFGCGGDRDRGKRPLMGGIAAQRADLTIVTSDNPRSEDPQAIVDEILSGVPSTAREGTSPRVIAIVDRSEAIAGAVAEARSADVVLIAGKGDEDYQEVRGVRHPFDDKIVAAQAWRSSCHAR